MKSQETSELQAVLGHRFVRAELLEQALTHTSQAREIEAKQKRLAVVEAPLNELDEVALCPGPDILAKYNSAHR